MIEQRNITCRHALIAILTMACLALALIPHASLGVTSAEVREQADAMMRNLDSIQTEINAAQEAYDNAVAAHDEAVAAMDDAQARIVAAEQRIADNQEELEARAVAIYRNGTISMLDVIMEATSFTEFVTLSNMVERINGYNAAVVAESKEARAEAQAAREEYEKQKTNAETQMQAANSARSQLSAKAAEMEAEVNRLTQEAAELQAQEEAAAEEARKAQEAAAQWSESQGYSPSESVITGSGRFTHPCPGFNYISSGFGYRDFDSSFHKGTDFAAAEGTPIYAADAGTVVIAGYSSSAGNWVVISHGDGLVTKYMHMAQLPFVVAGQSVPKGYNIGVVGTTGYSTGPHLHFQVEVDGTAVNPLYYL